MLPVDYDEDDSGAGRAAGLVAVHAMRRGDTVRSVGTRDVVAALLEELLNYRCRTRSGAGVWCHWVGPSRGARALSMNGRGARLLHVRHEVTARAVQCRARRPPLSLDTAPTEGVWRRRGARVSRAQPEGPQGPESNGQKG